MILVLAGTVEGRQVVQALQRDGWPVLASVTTRYGTELLQGDGALHLREGALDLDQLRALLDQHPFQYIVDATHPFAEEISRNAMLAADDAGIEYLRLERPEQALPEEVFIRVIEKLEDLAAYLQPGQRVLSTIGSKNLSMLLGITAVCQARLIARVLPSSQVLKSCEEMGLQPDQLIAMKGPFSREMNEALLKKYQIDLIITKESGSSGGFEEKLQAAAAAGIPIVVWKRPRMSYPRVFHEVGDLTAYINQEECSP